MNEKENTLSFLWLFVDLLVLVFSVIIAYWLNIGDVQQGHSFQFYLFHVVFSWITVFLFYSQKNSYFRDSYKHRVLRILQKTVIFTGILIATAFLISKGDYSRWFLFSYVSIFILGEIIIYKLIYTAIKKRRKNGKSVKNALIVGYTDTSVRLKEMFQNNPMVGYKFAGYVKYAERDISEIPTDDLPLLAGDTNQLENVIKQTKAEVVFSVFSIFQNRNNIQQQLAACNHCGVRLYLIPEIAPYLRGGRRLEYLDNLLILNPQWIPLDDIGNRMLKRSLDLFVSGMVILFIFSWLFPILGIIIKLTSKGPVFFRQERTGLNNKNFKCLKFRSMKMNANADTQQATVNDSRITSVGRFMREKNIDELPQFFNVFFGQMSLVGPRPHMLTHTKEYSKQIEFYLSRHYIKPGITGWAQVNGYRGETDELWKMEKRVEYDREYINNWNFGWDIKILWMTLFSEEAYSGAG